MTEEPELEATTIPPLQQPLRDRFIYRVPGAKEETEKSRCLVAPAASEGQSHVLKLGSQAAESTLTAFTFCSVHCARFVPWAVMGPS